FVLSSSVAHRALLSFPTRRSSDLVVVAVAGAGVEEAKVVGVGLLWAVGEGEASVIVLVGEMAASVVSPTTTITSVVCFGGTGCASACLGQKRQLTATTNSTTPILIRSRA